MYVRGKIRTRNVLSFLPVVSKALSLCHFFPFAITNLSDARIFSDRDYLNGMAHSLIEKMFTAHNFPCFSPASCVCAFCHGER